MKEEISRVRLSYGRALSKRQFLDRFYELFMSSSPIVARKLALTDIAKQQELLSQAVNMVILFPQGNKIARNAINRIRQSHNRDGLDIRPEYYRFWIDSLVLALSEHDPDFNDELDRAWRKVAQEAIDFIVEGH
ncbi:MAG: hypothetical protein L3J89_12235 [Gammaproteobacteria bacterium]|nr:hypothetical protein [Gammaproteobacteria bacterium]